MTQPGSDGTSEKTNKIAEPQKAATAPSSAEMLKEALGWYEYLLREQEKGPLAAKVALRVAGGTSVSGG